MRAALVVEFLVIFVGLPSTLAMYPLRWWPLPILWVVTLYCYIILRQQPDYDHQRFWGGRSIRASAGSILALFVPVACLLAVAVYEMTPRIFLSLPRRNPALWMIIMVAYPLVSVVPQTIVYRAFIFERYARLGLTRPLLIVVSGLAFSFLHIVLRNYIAPALTLIGGLLFAWRFSRTQSVAASAFEHALYGCLMFTLGLGAYFYTGAVR